MQLPTTPLGEAQQIKDKLTSSSKRPKLIRYLPLINTCVALAPLFGLLGTVTGMIEVFQVMAFTGGGDARSMAGGVSKATLTNHGRYDDSPFWRFCYHIPYIRLRNREEISIKEIIRKLVNRRIS